MNKPKYPIFVISKKRWKYNITCKELELLKVNYYLCVEENEYNFYKKSIENFSYCTLLKLPFSDVGCSIPARNYVWEYSKNILKTKRHWILDDNIRGFYKFDCEKLTRPKLSSPICFTFLENFVDRYENVPMAGLNYRAFVIPGKLFKPFTLNTRIYSCILLENSYFPEYQWRGKYNEDTDLSLRFLKDGYCTILLNYFMINKLKTMTLKGGNTDLLYRIPNKDGRLEMAKSLFYQHPDVVSITYRWKRFHHLVNYKPFRYNKLIPIK